MIKHKNAIIMLMEEKNKNDFHSYESYQPEFQPVDTPKSSKFTKINTWLKSHKKIVLIVLAVVIILVGSVISYLFTTLNYESVPPAAIKTTPKPVVFKSPLTGTEVSEADTKRIVTAIMIENSPEARPQSGLKESGVVFEAIAEGGITRFLTLHQEGQPGIIGPVRSLRPYYIDWLAAFDPSVAHVGGSQSALKEIRNGSYKDIDQFSNGNSYWRAKDRYAPHNVYTNFEKLNEINTKKGFTTSQFTGFPRKADTKSATPNATAITVPISSKLFNSNYSYDAATNSYLRSQNGQAHTDREKGQINPKVVIVVESPMSIVREDGLRESIKTIGSGKATVFQDGVVTAATWEKKSKKEQITFIAADGKAIALNAGQTWITIIPTGKTPTWQ